MIIAAIYGSLRKCQYEVGDIVGKGKLVGYIAEPTKYYSVEGSNLYFALQKDGEPVDPVSSLSKRAILEKRAAYLYNKRH